MKLCIYGGGGLGREVLELSQQINNAFHKWDEIIFIDDIRQEKQLCGCKVFSFEEALKIYSTSKIEFIIAVGEPESRRILWEKLINKGCGFTTLIHPKVFIPESTKIKVGAVISSGVFISCGVEICENVYIQPMASIGHDSRISSHCVISTFASFAGHCIVGESSFIAMSVPIKENTSIGCNTIIGMGSVVLRDIPDNVIALGNPARAMQANEHRKVFH